jgi:predicted ATPase
MTISALTVENFKGIADQTAFKIRPITIFVGANSSGKSSCIHALACLSQTIKLGDASSPLVLDNENAQVHLGRFIEIVHSKSYSDPISLGISAGNISIQFGQEPVTGEVSGSYTFKSTKRTQEISLAKVILKIGARTVTISPAKGGVYKVIDSVIPGIVHEATHVGSFSFMLTTPKKPTEEWFATFFVLRGIQEHIEAQLRKTLYLGPFRRPPARRYPFRGSLPSEVGAQGEEAIALLAHESVQPKNRPHTKRVAKWLKALGLAKAVGVSRLGASDLFDVSITLEDDAALPISDLGYGLSQILPVLAQCSFAPQGSTLLFEQPELHLHPGAARKLAQVFVEAITEKEVKIVAETHSQDLLIAMISELKAKRLALTDIVAYEVQRIDGKSVYREIIFVQDGDDFEADHPWFKSLEK